MFSVVSALDVSHAAGLVPHVYLACSRAHAVVHADQLMQPQSPFSAPSLSSSLRASLEGLPLLLPEGTSNGGKSWRLASLRPDAARMCRSALMPRILCGRICFLCFEHCAETRVCRTKVRAIEKRAENIRALILSLFPRHCFRISYHISCAARMMARSETFQVCRLITLPLLVSVCVALSRCRERMLPISSHSRAAERNH